MHLAWLALLPLARAVQPSVNDTLLWGAYRPNLYFGLRPRIPQSLMTGLIWFGTQDYQSVSRSRHGCDQGDGLAGYTWTEYDPREGGVQVINDTPNNVRITTEFIKVAGGNNGGSWAARIKGEPLDPNIPSRISTIFYMGLEGLGGIDMVTDEDENGLEGDVEFTGTSPELDDFTIRIVEGPDNQHVSNARHASAFEERIGKTHYAGLPIPAGNIWQAREILVQSIIKRANEVLQPYKDPAVGAPDPSFVLHLNDEAFTGSNLYAVQKLFDGPFQFDVFYESASAKQKLSSAVLDQSIPALQQSYAARFDVALPYPSDFPVEQYEDMQAFSRAVTSNLVGGVGYFYGTSIVQKKSSYEWDEDEDEDADDTDSKVAHLTPPNALLTATPSRSFFPRGFYWDEGFHLLHIFLVDPDYSLEILHEWIDLIDDDGWVAREQILGEEARSRVPVEFQTQVPSWGNPPTLTLVLPALIEKAKAAASSQDVPDFDLGLDQAPLGLTQPPLGTGPVPAATVSSKHLASTEATTEYLTSIYPALKRHYEWFRRTQRGLIKQYGRRARSRTEAYRWRGRSPTHVLTSGMDDYPRGPPHAGELHVDLLAWMAHFTRTMRGVAEFVGQADDAASYREIEEGMLANLEDLHWSKAEEMFCDLDVDDEDESYHECHKGYVSILPAALGLLDSDSPKLKAILELVRDPEELWSPYGIRSLAKSHPEYGKGENYWKGPIWLQVNYLMLSSLHKKYAAEEGPYRDLASEIYTQLRKNLVENIYNEYKRTGYVWEQYDANTGKGQRSHPFTGWTSLVALILAEKYP
ncbi:glycoside hydrolase family 63 protein [Schizophyllum commune]